MDSCGVCWLRVLRCLYLLDTSMVQIPYVFTVIYPAPKTQSGALTWTFRTLTERKWIDWEEDLACLALLNLLLPLISQTLSFSPPADPSHPCLYLFAPSIWFLSSPHLLLRSSQQTISLTFFAVYLPRPKQTVIFSFVLPPTFSLWGLCKGMENRRVTQISNIHPIFRIITFHCVQNRKFTPYHAAYPP